jgi:hypothetical protein
VLLASQLCVAATIVSRSSFALDLTDQHPSQQDAPSLKLRGGAGHELATWQSVRCHNVGWAGGHCGVNNVPTPARCSSSQAGSADRRGVGDTSWCSSETEFSTCPSGHNRMVQGRQALLSLWTSRGTMSLRGGGSGRPNGNEDEDKEDEVEEGGGGSEAAVLAVGQFENCEAFVHIPAARLAKAGERKARCQIRRHR